MDIFGHIILHFIEGEMMDFIIIADDYGLSKELTDNILDCVDNGVLNNVSLVPNGDAFDYAIKEYKKRDNLNLSIHLNLYEGNPISKEVDMLVDEEGNFCHSFLSLWRKHYFGDSGTLEHQVRLELKSQIEKVKKETDTLNINSHRHFHLIPFVFGILLELNKEYDFSYIRTINEPFVLKIGTNIFKHLLLNRLSKRKIDIQTSDYFIGVLPTGNMSIPIVSNMLSKIPHYSLVEILFHKEFQVLRSPVLKRILDGRG